MGYEATSPLYHDEHTTPVGTEPTMPLNGPTSSHGAEAPFNLGHSSSQGPDFSAPGAEPTVPGYETAPSYGSRPQTQQPDSNPYASPLYEPYGSLSYSLQGYDYGQPPTAPPYGAPMAYGGVQPSPYGPYQSTYGMLPEHPSSTTVLVLALLSPLIALTAPMAWYLGAKARGEIRRGAPYRSSGTLMVGYVVGIVVSCLLGLMFFIGVLAFVFAFMSMY